MPTTTYLYWYYHELKEGNDGRLGRFKMSWPEAGPGHPVHHSLEANPNAANIGRYRIITRYQQENIVVQNISTNSVDSTA
jgi:hypothetical protein